MRNGSTVGIGASAGRTGSGARRPADRSSATRRACFDSARIGRTIERRTKKATSKHEEQQADDRGRDEQHADLADEVVDARSSRSATSSVDQVERAADEDLLHLVAVLEGTDGGDDLGRLASDHRPGMSTLSTLAKKASPVWAPLWNDALAARLQRLRRQSAIARSCSSCASRLRLRERVDDLEVGAVADRRRHQDGELVHGRPRLEQAGGRRHDGRAQLLRSLQLLVLVTAHAGPLQGHVAHRGQREQREQGDRDQQVHPGTDLQPSQHCVPPPICDCRAASGLAATSFRAHRQRGSGSLRQSFRYLSRRRAGADVETCAPEIPDDKIQTVVTSSLQAVDQRLNTVREQLVQLAKSVARNQSELQKQIDQCRMMCEVADQRPDPGPGRSARRRLAAAGRARQPARPAGRARSSRVSTSTPTNASPSWRPASIRCRSGIASASRSR